MSINSTAKSWSAKLRLATFRFKRLCRAASTRCISASICAIQGNSARVVFVGNDPIFAAPGALPDLFKNIDSNVGRSAAVSVGPLMACNPRPALKSLPVSLLVMRSALSCSILSRSSGKKQSRARDASSYPTTRPSASQIPSAPG